MRMQPGQTIEIQLVDSSGRNIRLGNVLPMITLFSGGHRHYIFDLRPTGTDGRTLIKFSELEARRREEGLSSLMDYNVPITALDPPVEISIPSESYLQDRLRGMEEWDHWSRPAWVLKWPVNGCLAPVKPVTSPLRKGISSGDLISAECDRIIAPLMMLYRRSWGDSVCNSSKRLWGKLWGPSVIFDSK